MGGLSSTSLTANRARKPIQIYSRKLIDGQMEREECKGTEGKLVMEWQEQFSQFDTLHERMDRGEQIEVPEALEGFAEVLTAEGAGKIAEIPGLVDGVTIFMLS